MRREARSQARRLRQGFGAQIRAAPGDITRPSVPELGCAYADYTDLMALTEELVERLAVTRVGTTSPSNGVAAVDGRAVAPDHADRVGLPGRRAEVSVGAPPRARVVDTASVKDLRRTPGLYV